jgi:signal transduction histidine kinase/DNA-binding response OmpR family regulator
MTGTDGSGRDDHGNGWGATSSCTGEWVLVADGDTASRTLLCDLLAEKGCTPRPVATGEEALLLLESAPYAVALVDLDLPGGDGLSMLNEIKRTSPETEVVLTAEHGSLDTAVKASRLGAYDYRLKPFEDLEEVWVVVRRAVEKRRLTLQNRELVADLEQRNVRLTAAMKRQKSLVDAGRAMSGILDIHELLDFFVGQVVKELDSDRASLMAVDAETGELKIVASRGISEDLVKKARVRVGEGVAGWVARTGKPILVKDAHNDPRAQYRESNDLASSFISSPIVLSIPILLEEKVLGVINVTNRRDGGSYDRDDMAFLYGLAGQAAVSMERARHFQELQKALESLRAAQESVVAVERLKALGQMAAGVAHDFNNILNAILGKVDLMLAHLESDGVSPEAIRQGLSVVERISLQGAETVRRIQDITRIRKDQSHEALDLNAVVREAIELTRSKWKDESDARGASVKIATDLGRIPTTAGSHLEITQVVSNLIFNAVEAMPEGGRVSFRTWQDGDRVCLEVADTGTGIPKEIRDRIFEPFFTTKPSGQGLGMAVVYGILSRYGGEISVDSEDGKGTTFRMNLPLKVYSVKGEAGSVDRASGGAARILLVEDDDLNREIFEEYVNVAGHECRSARKGTEAVEILERERFDLVVTDLSMPGMSGWQVARHAKDADPTVPVVLLTGWSIQQEEEKIRESGVDFVVSKPCSLDRFRRMVEEALGTRDGQGGGTA